jgi:formylglycine-generating enzyme required for sulfatase activity
MTAIIFRDFELLVTKSDGLYKATVVRAPVKGRPSCEFAPPFSEEELRQVVVERTGRGLRPFGAELPVTAWTPKKVGQRLYEIVFARTSVGSCLQRSLQAVEDERKQGNPGLGLRIRVRLDDDPAAYALRAIPWEDLYGLESEPERQFALSPFTPIVRCPNADMGAPKVEPPLRILVVSSNPKQDLKVEAEWKALRDVLRTSDPAVHLELIRPPRQLEQLHEKLQTEVYHVFHFIGHGDRGALVFEGAPGESEEVEADVLSDYLSVNLKWKMVFLNACNTAATAHAEPNQPIVELARELSDRVAPAVIAMQFPISDDAAIKLSDTFYRAIARGEPVETALAYARLSLRGSQQDEEWPTAVLFSGCDDNRLLDARPTTPVPPASQHVKQPPFKLCPHLEGNGLQVSPGTPLRQVKPLPATVVVPAGTFKFGSPPEDRGRCEWPLRDVSLPAYAIGKYPVTNEEYAAFVSEHPEYQPQGANWRSASPPPGKLRHPVVRVTWKGACMYCLWLSLKTGLRYRLPMEAEWEKAARGSEDARRYPWGPDKPTADRCNLDTSQTYQVGSKPTGVSPYGCHDMIGGVLEWTCTKWGNGRSAYDAECVDTCEPEGVASDPGALRVCRGGASPFDPNRLGCSVRSCQPTSASIPFLGFRVLREIL